MDFSVWSSGTLRYSATASQRAWPGVAVRVSGWVGAMRVASRGTASASSMLAA